ncbi:CRISPR-associated protein Cas5 [Saccharopolyspora gregorii]|uniref:CRISPR-associated protein Cas5 n=1 Tax=Saccharopolyspora gregorii TaxID=33914 RepID=A0ABP6RNF7_9PSEU
MSRPALEVTVTAPVASFRNPLYAVLQVGLPCPPPSTVGGMLAAAAGGWRHVPDTTRFAMAFRSQAKGTDLETFHPLQQQGKPTSPTPKERDYLWGVELTLWLLDELEQWERRLRRPVWPLRLGRSQDLATARTRHVELSNTPGTQGHALLPEADADDGEHLRMPTAVSLDRAHTRWGTYRYASDGSDRPARDGLSTADGLAVVLLPPVHPDTAPTGS